MSAATSIIYGHTVGYVSRVIPIFALAATNLVSHLLNGMYGCARAAVGTLSTKSMGHIIDAYGPISGNAGGIAGMSYLVRTFARPRTPSTLRATPGLPSARASRFVPSPW